MKLLKKIFSKLLCTNNEFVPQKDIQKLVYSALSDMYGNEAPMYKLLLAVNRYVNELEAAEHPEWGVTEKELNSISSERHGAIRIASSQEFATITRFFAVMGMEPHNAYMMTEAGDKSQPIIGTGFRAKLNPAQRMFCSTLMVDYFDKLTSEKISAAIENRNIFSDDLMTLIKKSEQQGGLIKKDVDQFVNEATKLFSWSGRGQNHEFYQELKASNNLIAADIVCFPNPHLNHLTPSSLNIDRLMQTMKDVLNAKTPQDIPADIKTLLKNTHEKDIEAYLNSKGMKDTIEGPATPKHGKALVFLRQVSYKALPEKAVFIVNGKEIETTHTARFGEIEQRGVAMTPEGRRIYDACLNAAGNIDKNLPKENYQEYERQYAECFSPLDRTHEELRKDGLAYYNYMPSAKGKKMGSETLKNAIAEHINTHGFCASSILNALVEKGLVNALPIRYDDFLPVSAAGIFASNLDDKKNNVDNSKRPVYTKQGFEKTTGVKITDADVEYAGNQATSMKQTLTDMGLADIISRAEMQALDNDIKKYENIIKTNSGTE